jgi:hypothetical protein
MEVHMPRAYDNPIITTDARGWPICCAWLREDGAPPVRVQVSRKYVEDHWGVDWKDASAVKAAFNQHEAEYEEAAWKTRAAPGLDYRVFTIG